MGFFCLLRPYKQKIIVAFAAILSVNILGLAFPWVIKVVIDDVLIKKDYDLLNLLVLGLTAIFILRFYFGYTREYLVSFIGENAVRDLRARLHAHLQRLSVEYVENSSTGKIVSGIIGDVESVKKFLFGGAIDFIYSFFNVFFVLCVLFVLDWRLTVVSLIYLPVFGFIFFKITPRLKEKHTIVREVYSELTSRLTEVFRGIRVVAGFSKEKYEFDRFNFKQNEIFNASMESHKSGILLWMLFDFISSLGLIMLIWIGARAVFSGRISAGELMAFYSYLGMLFFPIIKMAVINNSYQQAAASMERITKILNKAPNVKPARKPITVNKIKGNIKFEGVSFGYGKERNVFSAFNLDVSAAQSVALIGKSGAGKTTLINLLLRFYKPGKGSIYIDGHKLKDLDINGYRSQIAMVLQDDYLFSATIKENILYSRPDADYEEIVAAAKLANAHEFIMGQPKGYDTCIGERGIKLSCGQRQRISIARAILRKPAILILDEATSNIDSETERLIIDDAFKNLTRGRTAFIISHRPSAVNYADKIVFIEDGKITDKGTPAELLQKKEKIMV